MRTKLWLTAFVLGILGVWQAAVLADDPARPGGAQTQAATESGRHASGPMIHRSSEISGFYVYDNKDVKLGKLDNLMVDAHTGQIHYGILDTGLFGKDIPVPYAALQMKVRDNKHCWVLNKSKDELDNAPTLRKPKRADFVNEAWRRSIDAFYGVHAVARPVEREVATETAPARESMILESSRLAGFKVFNPQNNNLGKVVDLIFDATAGQLLYGIVDSGVSGKRIAVPWSAFRVGKEAERDSYWLTLDKSKDQLASAPMFDTNQWPDFTSQDWRNSVDRFYGVRTAAQPRSEGVD